MQLERAGQERVIVPAGATHAVKQVVDFVDQRLEERLGCHFDARQQRANGGRLRQAEALCKSRHGLFAVDTTAVEDVSLVLDGAAQTKDAIGIPLEKTFLLLLEQAEKFAILSEFLPETFSDALPVHIMGFQPNRGRS